ncbi:MAG: hypothetical protein N3E48_03600, partial [Candidatus Bathyarchaeota archaeon]|nr:hypothetical protein [Candidatus Bathyarchaeota archaeon]
ILGCTTLLIVEVQHGEDKIGLGMEGFIADGIILLKTTSLDEKIVRVLELLKMRGTPTTERRLLFTLKDGFKAFPPFKPKQIEKPSRFQPQPDREEYFSTGSPDLDEILGGGYPRGSTVLLDIDPRITTPQYYLVLAPTAYNFASQGRGIAIIPTRGVDHHLIVRLAEIGGFTKDEMNRTLRVFVREYPNLKPEPYIAAFKGESPADWYARCAEVESELGKPVLSLIGADTLMDMYGVREAFSILKACVTKTRERRGLCIITLRAEYSKLAKNLSATAEIHLKFTRKHGSVIFYGVKPRTNPYVLEVDVSKGYFMPRLTPII